MPINLFRWSELSPPQREVLFRRAEADLSAALAAVQPVLERVRREGDEALREYTRRFDSADLAGRGLRVEEEAFERAEAALAPELKEAIRAAVENVRRFHREQLPPPLGLIETQPGVYAGERFTPIPSAGLYVPRGRGSFPSVMYMQALPAAIAGVERIVAATPPDPRGEADPATLYAARLGGVHDVYRVGGAQAVAALAFGTESIPRVDKITGPGSVYVAAAKQLLAPVVDVGIPAGPSESIVLADERADPWRAALDLMIEAEHGSDSSAYLVTDSEKLARAVRRHLAALLGGLEPGRAGYVQDVLAGYGGIVLTPDWDTAVAFVNRYAPEHLQIATADPLETLSAVRHAGEILLGQNSPFSLANYAVGANNVIPTGGRARTFSPLSVRDFMKASSVVYVTGKGLRGLEGTVRTLAEYEGFAAHAAALARRSEHEQP
jgi:histidinol dehydrogenase